MPATENIGAVSVQIIGELSPLQKAFEEAKALAASAAAGIAGKFNEVAPRMQTVGALMTAGITVPLAGIGAAATKMAVDFDAGMRRVTSLLGSAADNEFKKLSDQTLEMSKRIGIDAVKATDALYEALSAGVPPENAITFLEVASKAAIAGLTSTKTAVDGMTTVMNSYHIEASRAKEVSDAMFQAVNIGKFTFEQLSASVGKTAGTAAQLGVDFKEVLAAAATITKQGFSVSEAMTQIQSAMKAIITPSQTMRGLFAEIGVASGSALLQARGFEGALNAISVAAEGNEAVLARAFGRMEGFKGILALTGQNAKMAAADLDSLKKSGDDLGATQYALDQINKSASRQFEMLTNTLKDTAIQLGIQLLPAVNTLLELSKPLVDWVAKIVGAFNALPEPLKTVSLALVALTAAQGPMMLLIGHAKTLIGIVPSLVSALGAGAGLSGILTALGPQAIAFGVAIAGWAIATAWTEVQKLNAELGRLYELQQRGVKATQSQTEEIKVLESVIRTHNATIGNQKIVVDSVGLSVDQYLQRLRDATKGLGDFKAEQIATAKDGVIVLKIDVDNLTSSVVRSTSEHAHHTAAIQETAQKAVAATNELKALAEQFSQLEKNTADSTAAIADWNANLDRTIQDAMELSATIPGIDFRQIQPLPDDALDALDEALETTRDLKDEIDTAPSGGAPRVFTTIQQQASITTQLLQTVKRELQSLGSGISRSIFAMFDTRGNQRLDEEAARLQKNLADREADLNAFADETARKIEELRAKDAAALAEEEADLLRTLDKKEEDYESYKASIFDKIDELREKHATELAREIDDLMTGQRKKEEAYAEYSQEVEAKLAALPEKYQQQLDKELESLQRSLRDRTERYEDFVQDNATRLKRLREDSADDIGDQSRNTARGISDKQKQFKRDEEDINTRIARLLRAGKKQNDEEILDLRRSLKRKREDLDEYIRRANEDLEDYTAEHRKRLAEQEADLNSALSREKRDYGEFLDDNKKAEAKARADAASGLAKEAADLRASLEKRAEELEDYRKDVKTKIEAITAQDAAELSKQESELMQSLNDRTEEWEGYKRDAVEKLAEIRNEHAVKLAEQETELVRKLNEKRTDWQNYKADVILQLQAIENEHTSALGRMLESLKGTLAQMVQSILGAGIQAALNSVFGGIFGNIFGGAAGQAAGAAGGAAGAAGGGLAGASGGLMGTLSAVGALGSFATGIVSAFQLHGIGNDTGKIEENTRFTAIAMIGAGGVVDTLREFLPWIKNFADNWFSEFMPAFASLMTTVEKIEAKIPMNWNLPTGVTPAMATGLGSITISNNVFRSQEDIDYLLDQMSRRLRETQQI